MRVGAGKFHVDNAHNKKGNRENQDIIDLHEHLLAYNKGSWSDPPWQCRWARSHSEAAKNIIESYADLPIWGFKDPRALLALAGWKKLIPHLEYVGIYRHPHAVAQSLLARGGIPIEVGIKLWLHYNSLMLREHRKNKFPIISFDLPDDQFLEQVSMVCKLLQLDEDTQQFFSEKLRTNSAPDKPKLSVAVAALYNELKASASKKKSRFG